MTINIYDHILKYQNRVFVKRPIVMIMYFLDLKQIQNLLVMD